MQNNARNHVLIQTLISAAARALIAWGLLVLAAPSFAQTDEEKARSQIQRLEKEIAKISREIEQDTSQRAIINKKLKAAELSIGTLKKDITGKETAITNNTSELARLRAQENVLLEKQAAQKKQAAIEVETAWKMGRREQLQLLMHQESPDSIARMLTYYRYFLSARSNLLSEYRQTLVSLAELQTTIETTVQQLADDKTQLQSRLDELATARSERQQAVASLSTSIKSKQAQLEEKRRNRKKLEAVLAVIEAAVEDIVAPDNSVSFQSLKGNMPWPIAGKASNRFGRSRNEGKMRWQGVNIPARAGTTVKAIHHGRIVYSDWLRGSGLLIIIDHGEGYMSLYANNESLLREVGEWVTTGTPISTVGNTGGQTSPALYFEVRHKGQPIDPAKWCRR